MDIRIGIDPGKSGGIVVLWIVSSAVEVEYTKMPETELDLWNYLSRLESSGTHINVKATIEKVGGYTGEGQPGSAMFNFGKGYGSLLMALTALDIPFQEVMPQKWMKVYSIPPKGKKSKTEHKEVLRRKAQQLYPKLELWTQPKTKGLQLAICDALLIAEYCRRIHYGYKE